MPRSYEEIIEQMLAAVEQDRMMMEDPSQMQDTMSRGAPKPNHDMVFNPQSYETAKNANDYNLLMDPTDILDKMGPATKYDDNQTGQQKARTYERQVDNAFRHPKTPMIDPDMISPRPPNSVGAMGQLYNQMPMAEPPISNMPQLPQVPQQNDQQMQALMDFYTGGGGVEI